VNFAVPMIKENKIFHCNGFRDWQLLIVSLFSILPMILACNKTNKTDHLEFSKKYDTIDSVVQHSKQFENELKEVKVERNEQQKVIYLGRLIFIILILLIFTFGYVINYRQKLNKGRSQLVDFELQQALINSEKLRMENELNSKMTAMSKIMLERTRNFAELLKKSQYNKDPEIIQLRNQLEKMADIHVTNDSEIKEATHSIKMDHLWEIESFNELTPTLKRILILSIEGFRPKEISQLLNMSYSHVRNSRAQLKKMIQNEGYEDFDTVI
jgi:hypothetical protein